MAVSEKSRRWQPIQFCLMMITGSNMSNISNDNILSMPICARKVCLLDAAMPMLFLNEFAQHEMFHNNVGITLRSPQAVLYPRHYVVAAAAATRLDAFAMHSGEAHRTTGST
jgi:hypothetical protein